MYSRATSIRTHELYRHYTRTLLTTFNLWRRVAPLLALLVIIPYSALLAGDTTPPVILQCASNILLSANLDCRAVLTDLTQDVLATDDSGSLSVTQFPAPGTELAPGTSGIVFVATDLEGNTNSCHILVAVLDPVPLLIACPVNLDFALQGTNESLQVNYPDPLLLPRCTPATISCVPPAGATFSAGNNLVVCVATDAFGVTVSCSFRILVSRPPVALDDMILAVENNASVFSIEALLANDSGAKALAVTVSPASTNLGSVTVLGGYVTYRPPTNYTGTDLFAYTLTDSSGRSATAAVRVSIVPLSDPSYNRIGRITAGGPNANITFMGIPGKNYTLERSMDLAHWVPVQSRPIPANGVLELKDVNPPSDKAYYRAFREP